MAEMIKGEKRYVGFSVASELPFTIASANYAVKTSLYETIADAGGCLIAGADAYFLLDTTKPGYVPGGGYFAYISIQITGGSELLVGKIPVRVLP